MRFLLATVFAAGVSLSAPAFAHEPRPAVTRAQASSGPTPECYCRAQGRIFAPGEMVCLRTGQGARLAACRMAINVMSWEMTEQPCPES